MRLALAAGVLVLAALGFVQMPGYAQSQGAEQSKHRSPLAAAPASAHSRTNPLEGKPEAALAGRQLFARYCTNCHGAEAQGGKKAPALRSAVVQQAPPGDLFWLLTNGSLRAGMPSWSRLPEAQRWQLVSYLKILASARLPGQPLQEIMPARSPARLRQSEFWKLAFGPARDGTNRVVVEKLTASVLGSILKFIRRRPSKLGNFMNVGGGNFDQVASSALRGVESNIGLSHQSIEVLGLVEPVTRDAETRGCCNLMPVKTECLFLQLSANSLDGSFSALAIHVGENHQKLIAANAAANIRASGVGF